MTTARNVAIILAIAALIAFLPGGGDVSDVIGRMLSLTFIGVIVFGLVYAYRQRRIDLEPLTPAFRVLLYGAAGVIVLALAGASKMTPTSSGTLLLIALLALGAAGIYIVWRELHDLR